MKYLHNPPEVLMDLMFDPRFSVIVHIHQQCGRLSLFLSGKTCLNTKRFLIKHLSSARVTVERVFGELKGRFRILMKRMDVDLDNVVKTIITCCVLHNICQKRGDLYIDDDEVLENVLINERLMRGGHNNNQNFPDADALRDVIAEYMLGNI